MGRLEGGLRMIRKMDAYKLQNAYRIYRSFKRSRRLGTVQMEGLPYSLSIEPTTACNLRCPECPSGLRSFSRPTGTLSKDFFESFIQENYRHLIHLTFYFQGEPFIHKDFLDMVAIADRHRVFTSTSTNGHFLDEATCERVIDSGLDRMLISIDGTNQDTYSSYRKGGRLDKVLAGTEAMVSAKKKAGHGPEIVFQFLVVRPNEHQVDEVQALGKKMGVDRVALKTAQIYDFEDGNELIPTINKFSRYVKNASGKYSIKNPMDDQCWKMWHSCVITWDGKVVPCCFDKDAEHVMGDLSTQRFEDIWSSKEYDRFRENILQSRSTIEMCRNCSEGTKVWA